MYRLKQQKYTVNKQASIELNGVFGSRTKLLYHMKIACDEARIIIHTGS